MAANRRFRNVVRIGPVQVATYYDGRGREKHTAACTAPRCGFSTDYDSRAAAERTTRRSPLAASQALMVRLWCAPRPPV